MNGKRFWRNAAKVLTRRILARETEGSEGIVVVVVVVVERIPA
jgi:hypothetical protein